MFKRLFSLLLCLCLATAALPVYAANEDDKSLKGAIGAELLEKAGLPEHHSEATPYLAMYVEYEKADEYCTTHAKATLLHVNSNGRSDNPAAQSIAINLTCEDTLELADGSDGIFLFDDLPCGESYTFEFDLFCEFPMEFVDPVPEPKLTISVDSLNVGSCEYVCQFDSTTEPRALVMGWDIDNDTPDAIYADVAMMTELFGKHYYNMLPTEVSSYYNADNFGTVMDSLNEWETDHNDVTYIYLNAHGATLGEEELIIPGFFCYAPGHSFTFEGKKIDDGNIMNYDTLLYFVHRVLLGKVVIISDVCFSETLLKSAKKMGTDFKRFSILTSTVSDIQAGAYDNPLANYGWFTKEVYDEFANADTPQTIGDIYNYIRNYADWHFTWWKLDPQFQGLTDTVVFKYDPTAWIKDPEFVVVEETLHVTPTVELFYKYLREYVVPFIGLVPEDAIVEPYNDSKTSWQEFWAGVIGNTSGLLSAAVYDFDFDGAYEMITVTIPENDLRTIEEEDRYMCMDLTLYEIVDGEVQQSDVWKDAIRMNEKNALEQDTMRVRMVGWDNKTYIMTSSFFTSGNSYDGNDGGSRTVQDGKFIPSDQLPVWTHNFVTEDGAPYKYSKELDDVYASKEDLIALNSGDTLSMWNFDYFERYYNPDRNRYETTGNYICRGDDYSRLHAIIRGDMAPQVYNLLTVTGTPVPTKAPEENALEDMIKAREKAAQDAAGAVAPDPNYGEERYSVDVSSSYKTGEISQVMVFGPGYGDRAVLMAKFIAAISTPEIGLDADTIAALSAFDYENEWRMSVNGYDLSFGGTPSGDKVLNLIWPD